MHRRFWLLPLVLPAAIFVGILSVIMVWHAFAAETNITFSTEPEIEVGAMEEDAGLKPEIVPTTTVAVPSSTVSKFHLHAPPLAYLLRVAGDPVPKKGEQTVRVPVLMYHHIRPLRAKDTARERLYIVTPDAFRAQMEGLARAGYHPITPDDLEQALIDGSSVLPDKPILLTFDDGFREDYTVVLPILEQESFQATFFVIPNASHFSGYMTKEMIQEAYQSGFVTIGSHTLNHPFLTRKSTSDRLEEIAGSRNELESWINAPVTTFAYPYGAMSQTIEQEVAAAGYTSAFGVRLGSLHTPSSEFTLRRIRVMDGEDVVALADAFSK